MCHQISIIYSNNLKKKSTYNYEPRIFEVVTRLMYVGLSRNPGDRRGAQRTGGSKGCEGHLLATKSYQILDTRI